MHIDLSQILSGAVLYGTASYAAGTIPTPTNPWAKWVVGILQFLLANVDKGKAAIAQNPKT